MSDQPDKNSDRGLRDTEKELKFQQTRADELERALFLSWRAIRLQQAAILLLTGILIVLLVYILKP